MCSTQQAETGATFRPKARRAAKTGAPPCIGTSIVSHPSRDRNTFSARRRALAVAVRASALHGGRRLLRGAALLRVALRSAQRMPRLRADSAASPDAEAQRLDRRVGPARARGRAVLRPTHPNGPPAQSRLGRAAGTRIPRAQPAVPRLHRPALAGGGRPVGGRAEQRREVGLASVALELAPLPPRHGEHTPARQRQVAPLHLRLWNQPPLAVVVRRAVDLERDLARVVCDARPGQDCDVDVVAEDGHAEFVGVVDAHPLQHA
mmetsp:Transcript_40185/g.94725  ORF Transcript_40185/g.94725 Transcript_40185/m.94725 type:complete len:263 (+) Transcript_40185:114-902(+)